MLFMVPFDGSDLSEAALTKAKLYAIALEEAPRSITKELFAGDLPEITTVSVVPDSREYAQEKGWINRGEEFRSRAVAEQLHRQVAGIAPSANFQTVRVDRWAQSGTIASRLRGKAVDLEATDVFIGSKNAGRLVTSISSVGSSIASDERFDVHIIRRGLPPKVQKRIRPGFSIE